MAASVRSRRVAQQLLTAVHAEDVVTTSDERVLAERRSRLVPPERLVARPRRGVGDGVVEAVPDRLAAAAQHTRDTWAGPPAPEPSRESCAIALPPPATVEGDSRVPKSVCNRRSPGSDVW